VVVVVAMNKEVVVAERNSKNRRGKQIKKKNRKTIASDSGHVISFTHLAESLSSRVRLNRGTVSVSASSRAPEKLMEQNWRLVWLPEITGTGSEWFEGISMVVIGSGHPQRGPVHVDQAV
jgi:hypothetical protein